MDQLSSKSSSSAQRKLLVVGLLVIVLLCITTLLLLKYNSAPSAISIAGCATITDGVANVHDFGAKGDGSTDDTAAIQKAADCLSQVLSLNRSLVGTLYLPTGTYILSKAVTISESGPAWKGLAIAGESITTTSIEQQSGGVGALNLQFAAQVSATIKRLTLQANVGNAGAAILASMPSAPGAGGASSLTVENVQIQGSRSGTGFFDDGIKGIGLTNPIINNVDISGNQGNGSGYIGDACATFSEGWGVTITGQSGCHQFTTAFAVSQKGGLIKSDARSFGSGNQNGFVFDAGGGQVDLEGVNNSSDVAIFDINNASAVTIANVMTLAGSRTSASPEHYDIKIANSQNISIANNMFVGNGNNAVSTNSISVDLEAGDRDAIISGNIFDDLGTGVNIASGVTGVQVVDNRFFDTDPNIVGTADATKLLPPECANAPCPSI